jgi:hypothetical protein
MGTTAFHIRLLAGNQCADSILRSKEQPAKKTEKRQLGILSDHRAYPVSQAAEFEMFFQWMEGFSAPV